MLVIICLICDLDNVICINVLKKKILIQLNICFFLGYLVGIIWLVIVEYQIILSLNHLIVGGVCNFLGSVLLQQKFALMDGPVLQPHVTSSVRPVLQISSIQKVKENTSSRLEGELPQMIHREETPIGPVLASLFTCVFLLPLSLPCVNWANKEGCCFT